MTYYIQYNGQTVGPMDREQLASYNLSQNTPVSADGGDWRPLYTYPELMEVVRNRRAVNSVDDSQRILCGVLALLIGGLGIQYFIIGKTTAGILNIVITLCTCGIWSIINFIQGILMLCMSDDEFQRKYVDTTSTFPIF